ncbi:hypothetical protein AAT19DRAFT_14994 [Rhodotorula toruloides]|uniref:Uncharacterized protein n=1 Tax=Rhodotorula toruloides TaxID=5286 RepID=A0A2T0A9E6_RHOTO|nr:hypothetical protein AAT19DRAFT_14994 [Rhodotorula toruloides]
MTTASRPSLPRVGAFSRPAPAEATSQPAPVSTSPKSERFIPSLPNHPRPRPPSAFRVAPTSQPEALPPAQDAQTSVEKHVERVRKEQDVKRAALVEAKAGKKRRVSVSSYCATARILGSTHFVLLVLQDDTTALVVSVKPTSPEEVPVPPADPLAAYLSSLSPNFPFHQYLYLFHRQSLTTPWQLLELAHADPDALQLLARHLSFCAGCGDPDGGKPIGSGCMAMPEVWVGRLMTLLKAQAVEVYGTKRT